MYPRYDNNCLPLHNDECGDYDGKRCVLRGFRPDRHCEPALVELVEQLRIARHALKEIGSGHVFESADDAERWARDKAHNALEEIGDDDA